MTVTILWFEPRYLDCYELEFVFNCSTTNGEQFSSATPRDLRLEIAVVPVASTNDTSERSIYPPVPQASAAAVMADARRSRWLMGIARMMPWRMVEDYSRGCAAQ